MATIYHRDQPGAPALSYAANNGQAGFNAVKAILKACLVYGYADKPAAGWELINEGAAFIVLRNGSHSGYVCLELVSSVMRVHLAETYTGMSGNIMTGAGVKSGNRTSSSLPQAVLVSYSVPHSASTTWVVIADERTFSLEIFSPASSSAEELLSFSSSTNAASCWTLTVGEDSEGNFISAGGSANTAVSNSSTLVSYLSGGAGFTVLKDPSTGLLVGAGEVNVVTPSMSATAAAANAIIKVDSVSLLPISWGSSHIAGSLRGVVATPEVQCVSFASLAAQCLGYPGPLTTRTGNTPIDLGDGHTYFVRAGGSSGAFWLVTDNPVFW